MALPAPVGNCEEGAIGERSDGGAKPGSGVGSEIIRIQGGKEFSSLIFCAIRHRFTIYHTIRHKTLHNIPLMQGFLQLCVILQRQMMEQREQKQACLSFAESRQNKAESQT